MLEKDEELESTKERAKELVTRFQTEKEAVEEKLRSLEEELKGVGAVDSLEW